jgi:hypothetical protein
MLGSKKVQWLESFEAWKLRYQTLHSHKNIDQGSLVYLQTDMRTDRQTGGRKAGRKEGGRQVIRQTDKYRLRGRHTHLRAHA